jgi:formamidopyrimidine-DNA glycosylase
MPELPEVNTIVVELQNSQIINTTIKNVVIGRSKVIACTPTEQFIEDIANQKIIQISRRGKFIVLKLSKQTLLIHLRMSGKVFIRPTHAPIAKYETIRLELSNNQAFIFEDTRKFGKWYLLTNPAEKLDLLGIEPFSKEFTTQKLQTLLAQSKQSIKPFLLDQKHIAGLGNIYVDEALWEAQAHPQTPANKIKDIQALHDAIIKVLKQAIQNKGTSINNGQANFKRTNNETGHNKEALKVYQRTNMPCLRCKTKIVKTKVAQRGTHLCPACQTV